MKYNIDNLVLFDADQNTVTHIETQECVSLTMSQSMLLELILRSKSEILSRDTIIDDLWNNYGVNSSGHTLNQYVSLLRKLFTHFGLQELIITIPRVGLRLNPNVIVAEYTAEILQAQVSDVIESGDVTSNKLIGHSGYKRNVLYSIVFIIFATAISSMTIYLFFKETVHVEHPFTFYNDKGCEIGLTAHVASEDITIRLAQAQEIIKENNLVCNKERIVYFGYSKSVSGKDFGRTMLAFCTKGDNQKLISCENYYYRNWRVE